jgi:DNA-binding response OmpR family regulator
MPKLAPVKVLIIDENYKFVDALHQALTQMGCVVAGTITDTSQAASAVQCLDYDIALLGGEAGQSNKVSEILIEQNRPLIKLSTERGRPSSVSYSALRRPFSLTDLAAMIDFVYRSKTSPDEIVLH